MLESMMNRENDPLKKLHGMIDGLIRFNAERECKGG
jgi:hypothetical protein